LNLQIITISYHSISTNKNRAQLESLHAIAFLSTAINSQIIINQVLLK